MGKLVESTFITLDGVISDPHVWGSRYWDEEHQAYGSTLLSAADALLLGRETYEGFAEVWPERSGDAYSDRINAMPKHVATRTLDGDLAWNARALGPDVAQEVATLKADAGQDLLKFGTGELDRTLVEHHLIDELHLWVFPAVAGSGSRLLDGVEDTLHMTLTDTTTFSSGIVVMVFTPE